MRVYNGPHQRAQPFHWSVSRCVEAGSHVLVDAVVDSYRVKERVLVDGLAPSLGPGMLVRGDRGLPGAHLRKLLAATGADLLWRIPASGNSRPEAGRDLTAHHHAHERRPGAGCRNGGTPRRTPAGGEHPRRAEDHPDRHPHGVAQHEPGPGFQELYVHLAVYTGLRVLMPDPKAKSTALGSADKFTRTGTSASPPPSV